MGRTTAQMAAEAAPQQRIALADLQPADVVFFGAKGPSSKPAQVDHVGIYLGNGWFVQAGSSGVALVPLTGWYGSTSRGDADRSKRPYPPPEPQIPPSGDWSGLGKG